MNRREYMKRQTGLLAGCVVAGGFGALLGGCGGLRFLEYGLEGEAVVISKRHLAELGEAGAALVAVPERLSRPIYLQRLGEGEYLALSTRCTHRGCQVEPEAGRLVCPCHGSEYTLAGEVVRGPAERNLIRFPVTVVGDELHIEVPRGAEGVA